MPASQEDSQGSASESAGPSWRYPHPTPSIGQFELLSRPPASDTVLGGGLVIPDPQYTLPSQATPPIERQSLYTASSRTVPPSLTSRYSIDASLHDGSRLPRELDEDTNLLPPHFDSNTPSGLPALPSSISMGMDRAALRLPRVPTHPTVDIQVHDAPTSTTSASSTLPPPFTLEPKPQWQPDPVLPVGRAWCGNNLPGLHRGRMLSQGRSSSERVRQSRDDRRYDPIRSSWTDEPSTSSSILHGGPRQPHNPGSKDHQHDED